MYVPICLRVRVSREGTGVRVRGAGNADGKKKTGKRKENRKYNGRHVARVLLLPQVSVACACARLIAAVLPVRVRTSVRHWLLAPRASSVVGTLLLFFLSRLFIYIFIYLFIITIFFSPTSSVPSRAADEHQNSGCAIGRPSKTEREKSFPSRARRSIAFF